MRIRKKEIRKLHKRREERYKALHKKPVNPATSTATGVSARAGAGGRTSTGSGGATSGGTRPTSAGASASTGASRPPRRPAGPPTEG